MTRAWTRTTADGDTVTVTVDAEGAAVSVLRITGAREGWVLSLDDFEAEWLPFLGADFDDATDDVGRTRVWGVWSYTGSRPGTTAMAARDFLGSGGLRQPLEIVSSVPETSTPRGGDQPVGCAIALRSESGS